MSTNRSHTKLSRTLLILLGILLACLLTLNARSPYSADLISKTTNDQVAKPADSKTILDQIGKISFEEIHKKISSLK